MMSDDDSDESSRLEIRIPSDDDPEEICDILDICKTDQGMDILQKLDDRRKTNKHCDVIIKVCKEEIQANKAVLTAASDYFDVMFSHDTKESQTGIVELREMEPVSVKKCIDFIYTGKLCMDKKEWEDVLYVASMMQLSNVCEEIEVFLRKSLRADNFFRIKKLAARFDLEELNEFCDEYAVKNLKLIMEEPDFGTLEFGYVVFLLSSQKQASVDEVFKMNLLLKWSKCDVENRQQDFSKICDVVDVQKLPLSFCKNLVENEPLCYGCAEFLKTVYLMEVNKPGNEKSTQTAVDTTDQGTCTDTPNSVNDCTDIVLQNASLLKHMHDASSPTASAIVILSRNSNSIISYQPSTDRWYKECKLNDDISSDRFYTAVVVANYLYVLLQDGEFYRISFTSGNRRWTKLQTSPYAYTQYVCTAVCGNVIYIAGGSQMGCFNTRFMVWDEFDEGPSESACSTLVECVGCIYSVGGGVHQKLKSVYRYDPRSISWCSVASMNQARGTPAAISCREKIYVAGGYNFGSLDSTECYDPTLNTWTLLSSMIKQNSYFRIAAADGKIFESGDNCIYVYDIEKDQWREHCKLPEYVGRMVGSVKAPIAIPDALSYRHQFGMI